MGRHSCCYKHKLRKGLWSPEEDEKLIKHITSHGYGSWSSVPKLAGLQRCGKSCRLRWINYLRPDLKRGTFSQEEENLIIKLQAVLGNRWSQIATQLPGRTDNEIKNLWNSSIKKKLRQSGMDPNTHKPLSEVGNDQEKSKTDEKTSSVLSSADAENSDYHGLAAAEKPKPSNSAPMERNPLLENSSNHLTTAHRYSTQELFLNRFVASYESSTSWKPSDLTGFPSFHQLNYGLSMNPNTSISDHFSIDNTIASTANLPSMASPSLSVPTRLKPPGNFPFDNSIGSLNGRFESWDSCTISNNSRTSNVSSTSGELQSNCSLFVSDAFPWTAAGCGKAEKEVHIPSPDGEDIKWAEYLQTPFLMGNSIHSHNPTGQDHNLYGETKSQAQFGADGSLDTGNWHPNQRQQQSLQATKIYSKRFQRLPVATFGQFS